jgi:DNA transformation protein
MERSLKIFLSYSWANTDIADLIEKDFKSIGSCKAFQLLHAVDPTTCINTLMALEGAVQEIRWHDLDPAKKQELKEFLQLLIKSEK